MIKKIIYHSGIQVVGKVIALISSLLITGVLTRRLGVYQYGQYALVLTLINLLIAIGNWGTQIIGVRELSRSEKKGLAFGSILRLRTILSLVAIALGSIAILAFPLFKDVRLLAIFSLPLVFITLTDLSFEIIFQTFIKMDIKTLIGTLESIVFFASTLLFLKLNLGLISPIAGRMTSKTISSFLSFLKGRPFLKDKITTSKSVIGKLFKESLPMGMLLVIFSTYDQAIDSFAIKYFSDSSQVGLYELAYKIYTNLVLPAYFLSNTIFPILSKKDKTAFNKTIKTGICLTILGLLILVPLTSIFSGQIIQILAGGSFSASIPILQILSIGLIFAYINHLTGFSLVALDSQTRSLKIGVVALVWNLVLNLIFIPRYGIIAAAWVTVSTEALVSCLSASSVFKILNKGSKLKLDS